MTLEEEAFARGQEAGRVEARLDAHDRQLAAINGSVRRTGDALAALTQQVQRLGDQAIARDATVVTTAKALKDAEDARRDKVERAWSPLARLQLALGAAASAAALIAFLKYG